MVRFRCPECPAVVTCLSAPGVDTRLTRCPNCGETGRFERVADDAWPVQGVRRS